MISGRLFHIEKQNNAGPLDMFSFNVCTQMVFIVQETTNHNYVTPLLVAQNRNRIKILLKQKRNV